MNEHIVKSYEDELNSLAAECVRMGGLCEAQVADAVSGVVKRNQELAASVVVLGSIAKKSRTTSTWAMWWA